MAGTGQKKRKCSDAQASPRREDHTPEVKIARIAHDWLQAASQPHSSSPPPEEQTQGEEEDVFMVDPTKEGDIQQSAIQNICIPSAHSSLPSSLHEPDKEEQTLREPPLLASTSSPSFPSLASPPYSSSSPPFSSSSSPELSAILIIGPPCAGKTTLAHALAKDKGGLSFSSGEFLRSCHADMLSQHAASPSAASYRHLAELVQAQLGVVCARAKAEGKHLLCVDAVKAARDCFPLMDTLSTHCVMLERVIALTGYTQSVLQQRSAERQRAKGKHEAFEPRFEKWKREGPHILAFFW